MRSFQDTDGLTASVGAAPFLYGVATSAYQDSGAYHCPHSQWHAWEQRSLPPSRRSGKAANLYDLYRHSPLEIIGRLQRLGVNCYRFSVDWSQIEPERGLWRDDAVAVYRDFCMALRDHGIQPFVTLYHFSEPLWLHRQGSFELPANSAHFIEFGQRLIAALTIPYGDAPLVEWFCTFNEPNIEAYSRYLVGLFPPCLYGRLRRGARFLINMLKAHQDLYHSVKGLHRHRHSAVRLGFTHQYLTFIPTNILMRPVARLLNCYHDAVIGYLKSGVLCCRHPFGCVSATLDEQEHRPADFIGVQYYGRVFLGLTGVAARGRAPTTMYGIYEDAQGLYDAIVDVHEAARLPVLVTENGISTDDEEQRARYLTEALSAAAAARRAVGPDNMLGYILWSFCDNFEWFLGWGPRFGAYALDKEGVLAPSYKSGVQPLVEGIGKISQSYMDVSR